MTPCSAPWTSTHPRHTETNTRQSNSPHQKKPGSYEVFAAFRTRLPYDTEDGFRYYLYDGNPDEEAFHDIINQVSKAAYYNTGVMPEYGDELLILSTCSYHTENGRFVVVGCRKK